MDDPLVGEITAGDHAARVVAVAGALAESAVTHIAIEYEDEKSLVELDARTTDLPGLLADPSRALGVHARARTLISVTQRAVNWITCDAEIDAAFRRARKSFSQ